MTDTLTTAEMQAEVRRLVHKRRVDEYNALCLRASRLLRQAETIATNAKLEEVHILKARGLSRLAGAMLYTIYGVPDAADHLRKRDDLELVRDCIDPLLEEIGADARANSHAISEQDFKDCFVGIIGKAIDGNASYLLERAAEAVGEDDAHDGRRQAAE